MSGTYGECIVTRIDDRPEYKWGRFRLRIDRADPRVLLSAELLEAIRDNPPGSPATFDGEVLRINGVNQTVIYRCHRDGPGLFTGEWPD